jgi:DNA-binding NarL/FixJ family response regulator
VSYKKVILMELSDIIRRIKDGQSISEISRVTGLDRKTVRKYISLIKQEDSVKYRSDTCNFIFEETFPICSKIRLF